MIITALLKVVLSIVGLLVTTVFTALGKAPGVSISIPSPLFAFVGAVLDQSALMLIPLTIWFVWRQFKA